MKKTLAIAALIAAATAFPVAAADVVIVDADAVDGKCFVFPLLPDCAAQWNDYWGAKGFHYTTPIAWCTIDSTCEPR